MEFVKSAISLACYRDDSSGGCIRMVNITQEKVERHYCTYQDFKIK
jgi:20S proteasome alpha/beta subunit